MRRGFNASPAGGAGQALDYCRQTEPLYVLAPRVGSSGSMLLYHFLSEQYGLKDLRERRLKISEISSLNDPFEFISPAGSSKIERKMLRDWRTEMAKDHGLLCFSANWHNPVQWAHYADRHRGLCLGFEIDQFTVRQVNYVQSRPIFPDVRKPLTRDAGLRFVDGLLYTKFAHWSYEDEYRLFTSKKNCQDGFYYVNFSEQLKLKSVLVGACSTLTRATLDDALGEQAGAVEKMKVRTAFKDFRMVRQKKESLWV